MAPRRAPCYLSSMRTLLALLLLASLAIPGLAWWLGSFTGLLIAVGTCLALVTATFAFSRATQEARESKQMQRAFGRSTTFLAELGRH